MNKVINRMKQPTPRFFKKLRNIGAVAAATAGTLLAAPLVLPNAVTQVAAYLAVAGAVISAVSQAAVTGETQ